MSTQSRAPQAVIALALAFTLVEAAGCAPPGALPPPASALQAAPTMAASPPARIAQETGTLDTPEAEAASRGRTFGPAVARTSNRRGGRVR